MVGLILLVVVLVIIALVIFVAYRSCSKGNSLLGGICHLLVG